MLCKTHKISADFIYEQSGLLLDKRYFILGSVIPDLKTFYPPHFISETEKQFNDTIKRLKGAKTLKQKSVNSGILVHYICDYFCAAHNKTAILHGYEHIKYEQEYHKFVSKNVMQINLSKYPPHIFEIINSHDIYMSIISIHKKYKNINSKNDFEDDLIFAINASLSLLSHLNKNL